MLKLYHNDMSTCAQKVRLVLDELGLEWESHHLKLRGDEQLQPTYLAINPKGQVPALVDGEIVVVESTVINEYLVDAYGGGRLLARDAVGRARMRWWTRQLDDDVFSSIGTLSQAISFRHQYLANGQEKLERILSSIPDEARREMKRQAFSTGMDNPVLPMAARRIDKLFADMDATLERDEWLAGDRLTLADVGIAPFVQRIYHLNQTMMFEHRSHLGRWFDAIRKLPSFKSAMADWFNPDYLTLSERTGAEARPTIAAMIMTA